VLRFGRLSLLNFLKVAMWDLYESNILLE
jgi:hypothetical protein